MTNIEKTVPETDATSAARSEATRQSDRYAVPPVDIYEKQDALHVLVDLPGVDSGGLTVGVDDGILTIEGRVDKSGEGNYLLQEFHPSSFFRQFQVAETIDAEGIQAVLRNGVLDLALPKVEKAKPRQIPVEVG